MLPEMDASVCGESFYQRRTLPEEEYYGQKTLQRPEEDAVAIKRCYRQEGSLPQDKDAAVWRRHFYQVMMLLPEDNAAARGGRCRQK